MWAMTLGPSFINPKHVHWEISIIVGITVDILGDLFLRRDS